MIASFLRPRLQCIAVGASIAVAPLAAQQPAATAIVGATLWDGTGAAPLPDAVVLVRAGRIACVGDPTQCPVPAGATVVDGRGRFLLPGLIDTHVHLLFRQNGVTDTSIKADLHDLLARGITTLRDMGNSPSRLLEAVDSAAPSPRVFAMQLVAGAHFFSPEVERSPDGNVRSHAPASIGMKQLGWWPILYTPSTDPESVVRQAREAGAIGLKLYQDMDSAAVAGLVTAAHAAGMTVWGHGWVQPASVLEQARAGQDGVVHAAGMAGELISHADRDTLRTSSDLLQLTADSATAETARRPRVLAALDSLAARGTFLEPTLRAEELGAERAKTSRSRIQALPNRYALAASVFGMEVTRQALARGVRMTAGTDHVAFGPVEERAQLSEELQLFVDSVGMSPVRALLAATRDAAVAIGDAARDVGTIAAGKTADLVLFSADPLADIANSDSGGMGDAHRSDLQAGGAARAEVTGCSLLDRQLLPLRPLGPRSGVDPYPGIAQQVLQREEDVARLGAAVAVEDDVPLGGDALSSVTGAKLVDRFPDQRQIRLHEVAPPGVIDGTGDVPPPKLRPRGAAELLGGSGIHQQRT